MPPSEVRKTLGPTPTGYKRAFTYAPSTGDKEWA